MAELIALTIASLSILLRVIGAAYSGVLLYRVRDGRFAFLTVMLTLMAVRQALTWQMRSPGLEELPGLIVSVFVVLTVYYLSQYVRQERERREQLQRKNEQLRGFRKAIQHAGHGIFITDNDGVIEYANPAVEGLTGYDPEEVIGENPRIWKSGAHDQEFYESMWETIRGGTVWEGEIVNERKDGEHCWVDMTIAPITDEDGSIERYVAVDTDVTERKERQQRIERQNEQLQTLNTTNRILREVNRELVEASTRGEIERAVCAEFADTDISSFAWIGTRNMVNEALSAQTHAGIDDDALESVVAAHNDSDDEDLVSAAIRTTTPKIADAIDEDSRTWTHPLADRGYRSAAAIPLVYEETVYGALEVVSPRPRAFDEIEAGVLAELGETIGYAINATESKQALVADTVVELEFEIDGGGAALVDLSDRTDGTVELERLSQTTAGTLTAYATVTGCDRETISEAATAVPTITDAVFVCDHEDGGLFRFDLAEGGVGDVLLRHGGIVTEVTADGGVGRLHAELPQGADIRSVVEAVQSTHDGIELLARRERDREARTEQEFRSELESDLTERQLEALRTAYDGGFFEWPRDNTGEEIAALMDVSQSTFLQHLRTAQRKTLAAVFDDSDSDQAVRAC